MGISNRVRVKDELRVRFRANSETGWSHEQEGPRKDKLFAARTGADSLSIRPAPGSPRNGVALPPCPSQLKPSSPNPDWVKS